MVVTRFTRLRDDLPLLPLLKTHRKPPVGKRPILIPVAAPPRRSHHHEPGACIARARAIRRIADACSDFQGHSQQLGKIIAEIATRSSNMRLEFAQLELYLTWMKNSMKVLHDWEEDF